MTIKETLIKDLKDAISSGKKVTITLMNSGVHSDGRNYWLVSKLMISVENEVIFDEKEVVEKAGSMWLSNYTGSELEKLKCDVEEGLFDYCRSLALQIIEEKYGVSENDVYSDDEGDLWFEKDGKRYYCVFSNHSEVHYCGKHIFETKFYRPFITIYE